MFRIESLAELAELAELGEPLYVRYSKGPDADRAEVSVDYESGCRLPGLSVNRLDPQPWWDRPVEHWVARQLRQYVHLAEEDRYAWVLTGAVVGRGPDCEPLLMSVRPIARLSDQVVDEATRLYRQVFDVGDDGT
ncbi:DUF6098 family protein [Oerskovia enterophila]|uniref:Uncharacterized protein n=1 Tax=Oerskovia enterophila TaxID=43678 RepID=A0ABX2Y8I6_9CELL|nr:DUF6098 family protein [Oerskovia enterophila]OCI32898.1 hypothetical protein OERS_04900 [Oerskovia enterophila]